MSSAKQRQLTGWVHCTTEIGPVEKHRQRLSNSTEAKGAFNVKLNLDVTEWNIKKKLMMKWCQSRSVVNSFGFRLTYAPGRVARRLHRTWSRAPYTHVLYKKCWHDVINDAVGYNINQMSFISSWIDRGIFFSTPTVWHSRPPFDILTMSSVYISLSIEKIFLFWWDLYFYTIIEETDHSTLLRFSEKKTEVSISEILTMFLSIRNGNKRTIPRKMDTVHVQVISILNATEHLPTKRSFYMKINVQ